MILVNTTYGWNCGDDLIREGVFRLLGIRPENPKVFINRCQVDRCHVVDNQPLWKYLTNMASPDELCRSARALVIAGTPQWVEMAQEFYQAAAKYQVPVYIVGVGLSGNGHRARGALIAVQDLIVGATVRDYHAAKTLSRVHGIPCAWFPDPAFSAEYPDTLWRYDLVLNYRAGGGDAHELNDGLDEHWRAVWEQNRERIDLVTVHDMREIGPARSLFPGNTVFYSGDYRDYKVVYSQAAHYIGGRVHGAIPVVATGGTAHLYYDGPKADAMQRVAKFTPTLTVSKYDGTVVDLTARPDTELSKRLADHADYWKQRRAI